MTGRTGSGDGCGSNDWTLASEGEKRGEGGGGGGGGGGSGCTHTRTTHLEDIAFFTDRGGEKNGVWITSLLKSPCLLRGGGGGGGGGGRNISYIHTKHFVIPHKPEWSQGVSWSIPENHYIIVTS